MSNDVEVIIRAKDATAQAFQAVSRALKELEEGADNAGKKTKSIGDYAQMAAGAVGGFAIGQTIMSGLGAAFSFAKDAVFGMNSTLETTTLQFTTLMGDSDKARAHVRDLFEFAKTTPFETGPVIEASRLLRLFGKDTLDTKENLNILGNAAATSGAPINELAFWVGRLYANLQQGKPFGEVTMRLTELGVMTPEVAAKMEKMRKAHADVDDTLKVLTDDWGKFGGAMDRQAKTWEGVASTFTDTVKILLADTFKPFFEVVRDGLGLINDALGSQGVQATMKSFGDSIKAHFGGNSKQTVLQLAQGLLEFGDTAVGVTKLTWQGFQGVRTIIAGTVAVILEGITKIGEGTLKMTELAAKLDPTGIMDRKAQDVRERVAFMRGLTDEFWDQTKAAAAATVGNDAFGLSMDAVRGTLQATRAALGQAKDELAASGDEADKVTVKTGQAKGAFDALGDSAEGAGKKAKRSIYDLGGVEEAFDKIADQARKANERIVKENEQFAEQQNKAQLEHADALIAQIVRVRELEDQNAKARRDAEFQAADYAIEQRKREGASKEEVTRLEREVSLARLNTAIADADAEYQAKVAYLDQTTAAGQAEYAALTEAHRLMVDKMKADWQEGQLKTQEVTKLTWQGTIGMLAQSFAQLSQIAGGSLSTVAKGIGTVIGAIDTGKKSLDAFHGGFQKAFSGGGLGSIMSGIGSMVSGIGGIASAAMAAVQGVKALIGLFKSDESKYVNKPRDAFYASHRGYDGLANELTQALIEQGDTDAGNRAHAMIVALDDADNEDKYNKAKSDIERALSASPRYHTGGAIRRAHDGMFLDQSLAADEVPIIAQTGEGVLSRRGMQALGGEATLNRLNAGHGAQPELAASLQTLNARLSRLESLGDDIARAVRDGVLLAVA